MLLCFHSRGICIPSNEWLLCIGSFSAGEVYQRQWHQPPACPGHNLWSIRTDEV